MSFDLVWLDALAALVVAFFVAKIALTLLWDATQELIDTALPLEQVDAIRGSRSVFLASATYTKSEPVQWEEDTDGLHLQVDPRVSVSEGHEWMLGRRFRQG